MRESDAPGQDDPLADDPAGADGLGATALDDDRPAARLRDRAGAIDRADRFEARMAQVERAATRRATGRRAARGVGLLTIAGVGCLVPIIVAAVTGAADPTAAVIIASGVATLALAIGARALLAIVARRRGADAWDWHHQRYVLLGNPAREVRDADTPGRATRGPLEP